MVESKKESSVLGKRKHFEAKKDREKSASNESQNDEPEEEKKEKSMYERRNGLRFVR